MSRTCLHQRKAGFTIVELIIIIAVIAILAVLSVVAYTGVTTGATRANLMHTLDQASTEMETLVATTRQLPNGIPAALQELQSDDVTLQFVPKGGPRYENLTPVQNGIAFYDICKELIADPSYSTIHGQNGNTSTVMTSCDANVLRGNITIVSWDTKAWATPVTRQQLQSYIDSIPEDSWWVDKQDVMRGFYVEMIRRFESRGGTWPITSFWDPWAGPSNSGVPKETMPPMTTSNQASYCVSAVHNRYPDMTLIVTSDNTTPREGSC